MVAGSRADSALRGLFEEAGKTGHQERQALEDRLASTMEAQSKQANEEKDALQARLAAAEEAGKIKGGKWI